MFSNPFTALIALRARRRLDSDPVREPSPPVKISGRTIGIVLVVLALLAAGAALGVNYNNLTVDGRTAKITTGLLLQPRTGATGRTGNTSVTNLSEDYYEGGTSTCPASEAAAGPWSARSTSTSTSETLTTSGVVVGDHCDPLECAAASSTNQALVWTCKVTAADTTVLRVTNASGATITPKTGVRGVHVSGI